MIVRTCISKKYILSQEEEEILRQPQRFLIICMHTVRKMENGKRIFGKQKIVCFIFLKTPNLMGKFLIGEKTPMK